jgi:hypothetical protein
MPATRSEVPPPGPGQPAQRAGRTGPSAGTGSPATSPTAGLAPLRTTIQRRTIGARANQSDEAGVAPDDQDLDHTAGSRDQATAERSMPLPVLRVVGAPPPAGESADDAAASSSGDGTNGPEAHPAGSIPAGPGASARGSAAVAMPGLPSLQRQRRPLAGGRSIGPGGATDRQVGAGGPDGGQAATPGPQASVGVAQRAPDQLSQATWALPGLSPATDAARPSAGPAWPVQLGGAPGRGRDRPGRQGVDAPPTMALARPAATGSSAAGSSVDLPVVSRALVPAAPEVTPSTSAPSAPSAPVLAPTATPVIQRIDTSASPTPDDTSGARSDDELDELARALFGRFRNRLRNEYIFEREAKGLTFDQS